MKKFFLISAFALFALLLFSSDSGAEEEFTISVDPGWMDEKERNCKTITANVGNSTEDGTYEYEECDYYLAEETNLTNDWIISAPLDSEFTFTLNGINF